MTGAQCGNSARWDLRGGRAGPLPAQAAAWPGLGVGVGVAVGNVDAHVTPPAANAIAPGIIESEAGKAAAANNPMYERFKARTVFKRFGQPADIANTIGFLCTEEAGYITGAVIEVAGGIPLFTA